MSSNIWEVNANDSTVGADDDEDSTLARRQPDVQAAADFMKLLSDSSLSTEEARIARLAGRKEISRLEEQSPEFARTLLPSADARDAEFDLAIADELELCDKTTFEAELRYRAIASNMVMALTNGWCAGGKAKIRRAALALAQILDAKGYADEALRVYARATQADDPNAAWRLAVISRQTGNDELATKFARLASATMSTADRSVMEKTLRQLHKHRGQGDIGKMFDTKAFDRTSTDVAFAMGSAFLAVCKRPDLASVAYCSALSRGHSLAAVTLLDTSSISVEYRDNASRALGEVLETTDLHERITRAERNKKSSEAIDFALKIDRQSVPLVSLSSFCSRKSYLPRNESSDTAAIQHVLLLTRATTALRGYALLGCSTKSRILLHEATDRVSHEMLSIMSQRNSNSRSMLDTAWTTAGSELRRARCIMRKDNRSGHSEDHRPAGVIVRYRRTFARLSLDQQKVVLLKACGASEEEIVEMLLPPDGSRPNHEDTLTRVRSAFSEGARRLRYGQRGEVYDTELWNDVESAFSPQLRRLFTQEPGSRLTSQNSAHPKTAT